MNWRSATLCAILGTVVAAMLSAALGPRAIDATDARVAHWNALTPAQRAALVERYQTLRTQSDLRSVEAQADELRLLSPAERARLTWLAAQVESAISLLPVSQRAPLRELPPAAQAVQLYHILDAKDPATLDRLAREWQKRS